MFSAFALEQSSVVEQGAHALGGNDTAALKCSGILLLLLSGTMRVSPWRETTARSFAEKGTGNGRKFFGRQTRPAPPLLSRTL